MYLEHITQVDKFIRGVEIGEPRILHCSDDSASVFLLSSSMRLQDELCSVVGRIFSAIKVEVV
jgi:hypothetical protein